MPNGTKSYLIAMPYGIERSGIAVAMSRLVKNLQHRRIGARLWSVGSSRTINEQHIQGFHNLNLLVDQLVRDNSGYSSLYWAGLCESDMDLELQIRMSQQISKECSKPVFFFIERTGHSIEELPRDRLMEIGEVADGIAVVSFGDLAKLRAIVGDEPPIYVLPTGVDTQKEFRKVVESEKALLRAKLSLPLDGTIVINTSRFVPRKGLDTLLAAWAHHRLADSLDATLILIGSGFDDPLSIEDAVRTAAALTHGVRIVTYSDSLRRSEYYQSSDIGVFPSRQDGEPTSIIECMACGLPIIASDIPGHRTLAEETSAVRLFRKDDRDGLAAELVRFHRQSLREIALASSAARVWASERRDINRITDLFLDFVRHND